MLTTPSRRSQPSRARRPETNQTSTTCTCSSCTTAKWKPAARRSRLPPGELLALSAASTCRPRKFSAFGALAFDQRPARPGRPNPMTAKAYARTVPHHTVYGYLYIRDKHGRPVQLRSVYGSDSGSSRGATRTRRAQGLAADRLARGG